jgi:arylmalonate decarboxylase
MGDWTTARPIGWRAKIGVIVPPQNTVNEAEFNRLAPEGVSFHVTRSPLHKHPEQDDYRIMLADVMRAMSDLVACRVKVAAYACTAGSMSCPSERLIGTMERFGSVKAVTTAEAILAALAALGVRRIAMATPYTDETNEEEKAFLERRGAEVVAMAGLGLDKTLETMQRTCRVPPAEVYAHAKSVDRPEAEAVLLCCTDLNTLDVIAPLEAALNKPVLSSCTATFWASLRAAGLPDKVPGYGRLLLKEHHPSFTPA